MENRSTVVGVFDDRAQAGRSVEELRRSGFPDDQTGSWPAESNCQPKPP